MAPVVGIDRVEAAVVGAEVDLAARGVEARVAVDAARDGGDPVDVAGRGRDADDGGRRASPGPGARRPAPPTRTPRATARTGRDRAGVVRQAICSTPARVDGGRRLVEAARGRGGAAAGGDGGQTATATTTQAPAAPGGSLELEHREAIRDLVPQRGGGVLVQHLLIDTRGLRPVASAAPPAAPGGRGPGPCRSRPTAASSPSLANTRLRLRELPLALVGVAEALAGREPQPRVELAGQQLLVDGRWPRRPRSRSSSRPPRTSIASG